MTYRLIIASLFFHLMSIYSFGQSEDFQLIGSVKGVNTGQVQIGSFRGNKDFMVENKIVQVYNGNFQISGKISEPTYVGFRITDSLGSSNLTEYVFIEPGIQYVELKKDSFDWNMPNVTGSKNNDEYINIYRPKFRDIKAKKDSLYDFRSNMYEKYSNRIPNSLKDSIGAKLKTIRNCQDSVLYSYVLQNPSSYVALWDLHDNYLSNNYKQIYDSAYSLFSDTLKKSYLGNRVDADLISLRKTQIGRTFPSIKTTALDGQAVQLSYKKNKYILIDFWFANCSSCRAQFAELRKIYDTYRTKGFEIIAISKDMEDQEKDLRQAIKEYDLQWAQWWDKNGILTNNLAIHNFPTNFLLDEKGEVIEKDISPAELQTFLQQNM